MIDSTEHAGRYVRVVVFLYVSSKKVLSVGMGLGFVEMGLWLTFSSRIRKMGYIRLTGKMQSCTSCRPDKVETFENE